jgi:SAM-dependent methyltransferase
VGAAHRELAGRQGPLIGPLGDRIRATLVPGRVPAVDRLIDVAKVKGRIKVALALFYLMTWAESGRPGGPVMTTELRQRLERARPKTKGMDVDWMFRSAAEDRADLETVRPFGPGDKVLDVGSGYGRLALAFAEDPTLAYLGLDVNAKRVDRAAGLFDRHANVSFLLYDVHNARYNARGKGRAAKLRVDLPDGFFAGGAAVSLFTHMPDAVEVAAYLREIGRLVVPGGGLLTTWLTSPPLSWAESSAHRAVFPRSMVADMLSVAGFVAVTTSGDGSVESHLRIVSRKS